MRIRYLFLGLLFLACSSNKKEISLDDRFRDGLIDIGQIATMAQLTNDNRSIYPIFSPGDSMVYYERLLITESIDTFAYNRDEMIKPYGLGISSGELYTLSRSYSYPFAASLDSTRFPKRLDEKVVWALPSPVDSGIIAFETIKSVDGDNVHSIYLSRGDSISQLTYGKTSCYLDRFSNTGRYLSAVYDESPTWIIIYDIKTGNWYRTNHEDNLVDYLTFFSPDDSMMLFIRSDKKYRYGSDYFGNIMLLRLNK